MRALHCLVPTAVLCLLASCAGAPARSSSAAPEAEAPAPLLPQPDFDTPEDAVAALYQAAAAKDLIGMAQVVGLPAQEVVTGDADKDAARVRRFVKAYDERMRLVADGDGRMRVFIGNNDFPLSSPLVRKGARWQFDSAGGRQELTNRIVGENELATIGVCRAFVHAQYEYYAEDRDGDDVLQFAAQLASSPGRRDGLYWPALGHEPVSPLGRLIADASADGAGEPKPYHGYLFKVLTAQGDCAPGGAHSYLVNGRMLSGFALVAYPSRWRLSGVMTFVVAANGKVLQKDLGERTAEIGAAMTRFDPDASWEVVRD
jgi:hypothetical protein